MCIRDRYLCTAISPEISDYQVDLKDIVSARNKVRNNLKKQIDTGRTVVEEITLSKQADMENQSNKTDSKKSKLKRYFNE